ncbi:hypothetical protein K461DRAFT_146147 [Myriangium duriaei CBS 260.36]|uniref:Uncharacterized protein n=1 Tax=Myriangium duriaei CBS 260.36 TaxID=1168546 RepID=A0A9P4MGP6_9PEZI|nr:hypothetical protein K461DRAFT_146147 [Myriangium duriaei CBS 260.36]
MLSVVEQEALLQSRLVARASEALQDAVRRYLIQGREAFGDYGSGRRRLSYDCSRLIDAFRHGFASGLRCTIQLRCRSDREVILSGELNVGRSKMSDRWSTNESNGGTMNECKGADSQPFELDEVTKKRLRHQTQRGSNTNHSLGLALAGTLV